MDRPRLIRSLRIAVSAVCAILCALFVVLWMRSYWRTDIVVSRFGAIFSSSGEIACNTHKQYAGNVNWLTFPTEKILKEELVKYDAWSQFRNWGWFEIGVSTTNGYLVVPHWFAILITLSIAVVTCRWGSWRFSLRTLLIATTLIAVLLGLGSAYLRLW